MSRKEANEEVVEVIARIGTFRNLTLEAAAESRRNLLERFLPALKVQPGFVVGYWLASENGALLSVTFWESAEAMERGGQRANAAPLLPGQDPARIPSPDTVETFDVFARG